MLGHSDPPVRICVESLGRCRGCVRSLVAQSPDALRTFTRATPSRAAAFQFERQTAAGLPLHSFDTLLAALATLAALTCRLRSDPTAAPVRQVTPPSPLQARAFELLGL